MPQDINLALPKELRFLCRYTWTFITIHDLTAEAIMAAHAKDLQVQSKYGVKYLKYLV